MEQLQESLEADSGAEMLESFSIDDGHSKAIDGLDVLIQRGPDGLDPQLTESLEAVVHLWLRPAIDIVNDRFGQLPPGSQWSWLAEPQTRARIERNIRSIGRIELPGKPFWPFAGTGFVVGPDLVMTNRHVADIFAEQGADSRIRFRSSYTANINFLHEAIPRENETEQILAVKDVVMLHPDWDMALLRVEGLSDQQLPLQLSATHPDDLTSRDIVVIGYPQQDDRGDIGHHNRIFAGMFGVKRMLPGQIGRFERTPGLKDVVEALTHDASTLGGNSGSAVIHVATGEVLGLHFAGEYLKTNYAVATKDLSQDQRVIDQGVNFILPQQPRIERSSPLSVRSHAGVEHDQTESSSTPQVPAGAGDGPVSIAPQRQREDRDTPAPFMQTQPDSLEENVMADPGDSMTATGPGVKLLTLLRSIVHETVAALSPLTNERELQETVWFIEAYFSGERNLQTGSGVMIRLRNRKGDFRNVLLTCQHVVRNSETGSYSADLRCWRHDDGYHPKLFWRANPIGVSGTRESQEFEAKTVGAKDWVLLEVSKGMEDPSRLPFSPGFATVSRWRKYRLLGFPSGVGTMDRNVVKASVSRLFRIARIDAHVGTLRLANSEKAGRGYSGGPYLSGNGRVVALHRSTKNADERPVGVDGKSIEAAILEQGWDVVEIGDKSPRKWAVRIAAGLIVVLCLYSATRARDLTLTAIEGKKLNFELPSDGFVLAGSSLDNRKDVNEKDGNHTTSSAHEASIRGAAFIWNQPLFRDRPKADKTRARFVSQEVFYYRKVFLGIPLPLGKIRVNVRHHNRFYSCKDFFTALDNDNEKEREDWYKDSETKPLISLQFSTDQPPELLSDRIQAEVNCEGRRIELTLLSDRRSLIVGPRTEYLTTTSSSSGNTQKYTFRDVYISNEKKPTFAPKRWSIQLQPFDEL